MYFATKLLSKVKNLVTLNHYFALQMKKTFFYILCLLSVTTVFGQESTSGYNTLKLPTSAHVAALGGENISIIDDDAALSEKLYDQYCDFIATLAASMDSGSGSALSTGTATCESISEKYFFD